MNPERLVAGLDIGSAKTTAIIAEVVGDLPKHPTIKVLGVGQARTTGMRRGVSPADSPAMVTPSRSTSKGSGMTFSAIGRM